MLSVKNEKCNWLTANNSTKHTHAHQQQQHDKMFTSYQLNQSFKEFIFILCHFSIFLHHSLVMGKSEIKSQITPEITNNFSPNLK